MTTTTKQRLTVKVLDDTKLEKFIKLQKELKAKKKAFEALEKELFTEVENGAHPHPNSKYTAQLEDKQMRYTPKYKDWYIDEVGKDTVEEKVKSEKKAWEKKVEKGELKPEKKIAVKEK